MTTRRLAPMLLALGLSACTESPPAPGNQLVVQPPARELADASDAGTIALEEGDLLLRARGSRQGSQQSFELRLGEGAAFLVLDGNGRGRMGARDADAGAHFALELMKWLEVPPPPQTHTSPLRPLAFEYLDLGAQDEGDHSWQYHKAFIHQGSEYTELFINAEFDAGLVVFRAKDSAYAPALAEVFADAFRDGPPPERTPENDANLETAEPLFELRPSDVGRSDGVACHASGWVNFVPDDQPDGGTPQGQRVMHSEWATGASKRWCTLPGLIQLVDTNSTGSLSLAIVSEPVPNGGDDDERSWPWAIGNGHCRRVPVKGTFPEVAPFDYPLVSPAGDEFAVNEPRGVRVFNLASGASSLLAVPPETTNTWAWTREGIVLKVPLKDRWVLVVPKKKALTMAEPSVVSLDGHHRVTFGSAALTVRSDSGPVRTFAPHHRADARAIIHGREQAASLLGPERLVLDGNPQLALSLTTLTTRALLGSTERFLCASPDGQHALFWDERSKNYFVGDRR